MPRRYLLIIPLCLLLGCDFSDQPEVVVYTALDELYSRPLLDAFEAETGIRVLAQYDGEAAKTTGLVNRLLSERQRPRADVFWNNEVLQTITLQSEGVLEPYASPSAEAIPNAFKDPDGYWTGFAARARVVIYNTDQVTDPPTHLRDFLDPRWKGKAAIANPLFGTTATHGAALFELWGDDEAKVFFNALRANDIAILPGNGTVRDLVARGEYAVGLTDTDDANGAVLDGFPVAWHPLRHGEYGGLLIPNTVALIRGAPNADNGRALIDFLLGPDVEAALARGRSLQIPLNPAVTPPDDVPKIEDIDPIEIDYRHAADQLRESARFFQAEFLKQ